MIDMSSYRTACRLIRMVTNLPDNLDEIALIARLGRWGEVTSAAGPAPSAAVISARARYSPVLPSKVTRDVPGCPERRIDDFVAQPLPEPPAVAISPQQPGRGT